MAKWKLEPDKKIVEVRWHDHWEDNDPVKEEAIDMEPWEMITVGYLVKETDETICLAYTHRQDKKWDTYTIIIKADIVRIRRLK